MKGKLSICQGNSDLMKNLETADLSFMKEIKGEEAEKVMQSFKEESDRAAGGLGFIFSCLSLLTYELLPFQEL